GQSSPSAPWEHRPCPKLSAPSPETRLAAAIVRKKERQREACSAKGQRQKSNRAAPAARPPPARGHKLKSGERRCPAAAPSARQSTRTWQMRQTGWPAARPQSEDRKSTRL